MLATVPPLVSLRQRVNDDWLVDQDSQKFFAIVEQTRQELMAIADDRQRICWPRPLRVILAEREPVQFLARFFAACTAEVHVFLANPDWSQTEWQQARAIVQPDRIWGEASALSAPAPTLRSLSSDIGLPEAAWPVLPQSLIMVPTGGSSGQIRFAMHTWETLIASVHGFQQHFGVSQINSICVLPLYHVSGLMQAVRSLSTGGSLAIVPFQQLQAGKLDSLDPAHWFLSLVPTQLQRWLETNTSLAWLTRLQAILLGGGPAWSELLEHARQRRLPLAPTYGMTETASQIATLKPAEFLLGLTGCGCLLPHAQIEPRSGLLTICAQSLALGYYPQRFSTPEFQPDDIGYLNDGYLHIVGRQSDKIITGGENVYPAEVEAALRATGFVHDVCVIGIPDRQWGQAIAAIYVADAARTEIEAALTLSRFKRPKHWILVDRLPRNAQGKLNRQQVRQMAQQWLAAKPPATQANHTAVASQAEYTHAEFAPS